MDCEQAITLISAEIDHEIQADERDRLTAHLRDCSNCAATAEAFRLQHADLRRTFAERRSAAARTGGRVIAELPAESSETHTSLLDVAATPELRRLRRRFGWAMTTAAAVAGIAIGWHANRQRIGTPSDANRLHAGASADAGTDFLTARRQRPAPKTTPLQVGETLRTDAGQTRRVRTPDGSIVYVNQNSAVTLEADRRVKVTGGEVFVEVLPQLEAKPFVVQTPQREITALGTKFDVRADAEGTGVLVTQGKVAVSGLSQPVPAGQHLD